MAKETKATKFKKMKPTSQACEAEETPTPPPSTDEPKPKRKLSKWQKWVSDFAKQNPKSGRNLFRLAYETYKKASPKA